MSHVAILSGYSLGLPAIRNRLEPLVIELLSRGHSVTIYSTCNAQLSLRDERIGYVLLAFRPDTTSSFFGRGLSELYRCWLLMRGFKPSNYDITFIGIPSFFLLLFSRHSCSTQILDIRDLSWEYLSSANPLLRIVKVSLRLILRAKLSCFDAVTCSNAAEVDYIRGRISRYNGPVFLMSNGISMDKYCRLSTLHLNKPEAEEKPVVSYIGNIGVAQRLETLVYAAKELPDIHFQIIGSGREFQSIQSLVRKMNLDNIHIIGRLDWDSIPEVYRKTHILFAQLTKEYATAIPSKLYEYLSTGKPIVYGGVGKAIEFLRDFENVSVIQPEIPQLLATVISNICRNPSLHSASNSNIESIQNNYIRETQVKYVLDRLQSIGLLET